MASPSQVIIYNAFRIQKAWRRRLRVAAADTFKLGRGALQLAPLAWCRHGQCTCNAYV